MTANPNSNNWQLKSLKQHIELFTGHPNYDAMLSERAALVTEWRAAIAAGDETRVREIEAALESKVAGVNV